MVKDEELIEVFNTQQEALAESARRFGTSSFLVRQVEESEELIYIPALTLSILRADSTYDTAHYFTAGSLARLPSQSNTAEVHFSSLAQ